ncbi:hypothetical protein CPB83DRAFT_811717 [Crepidotus variabilis]|uniref:Amidohydrolase-related domain-containing protein n=1 Tax=Crepidotus variabilis TaxID=179855 RepID=A0A9P6EHD7_9AGAR|nr:hypothetical protein CPB83DRAFT_811717 [Crepidotus variabilis]
MYTSPPPTTTPSNGLICFTNCLLPLEDGSLVSQDLWIDERRGVILDAQKTFYMRQERPSRIVDLEGCILSPGFLDIQINGAYGFDFSVYEKDDETYQRGLYTVASRIVETGVTSLLPTLVTLPSPLYPTLLRLLRPISAPGCATLLGWHAEGPFIDLEKRGAHESSYLRKAECGFGSFEDVYGAANLVEREDWDMSSVDGVDNDGMGVGVRVITTAPEIPGVLSAIEECVKRGIIVSIGHSRATTPLATLAILTGARLITHLFNAMPQMHHRDPAIVGLLGASPFVEGVEGVEDGAVLDGSEALEFSPKRLDDTASLPGSTPISRSSSQPPTPTTAKSINRPALHLEKGQIASMPFERPFYGLIVDGIHCHPNSVRLAYSSHPEGCVLVTDAMKILDPNLSDGIHEWRDGKRFVKEGDKLYLEGTSTLAGSVVTMDKCIRNFSKFTGCSLGEAIKCATYNPAKCLGIESRKGTLRPGAHADFAVLDKRGVVRATWVAGREVWRRT